MEIVLVSLLGGLLALDSTSVGQFMASRPLVAGALTGWLVGEPTAGIAIGAILELYLLVSFPTGGSRFPEGSTATVVAVAAAGTGSPGALAVAIAAGLVWGQLAGVSITYLRHVNARLVPDPDSGPTSTRRLAAAHLGAILLDFARGVIVTLAGVLVIRPLVEELGASWPVPRAATFGLLLVGGSVSVGILLRDFGGLRRHGAAFAVGLALAVLGAGFL
jgi:mannose/fructose/N-acetylgalactosamine-specific phosphotransferase system component IIC